MIAVNHNELICILSALREDGYEVVCPPTDPRMKQLLNPDSKTHPLLDVDTVIEQLSRMFQIEIEELCYYIKEYVNASWCSTKHCIL